MIDAYSLSARSEYPLFAKSCPNKSPDVFTQVPAAPEKPIDTFIYFLFIYKIYANIVAF